MRSSLSIRSLLCAVVGILGALLVADAGWRFCAAWRSAANLELARRYALADRTILATLQALRFEKVNSVSYLLMSPSQTAGVRETLAHMRAELDDNLTRLVEQGAAFSDEALDQHLRTALENYKSFVSLREALDQLLTQELAQRDAAFSGKWSQPADRALSALERLSDSLGNGVERFAPDAHPYIIIRQNAWRARAAIGPGYTDLSRAVARTTRKRRSQATALRGCGA